jgi:Fe-S-cluster containining protein
MVPMKKPKRSPKRVPASRDDAAPPKAVDVEFQLDLGVETVTVSLQLPTAPTPARRMLPVLQTLVHKVIDVAVKDAKKRGETVSCKAGCGACCRQIVPISLTEARRIAALVDGMAPPRRARVRERFTKATARLQAAGLLDDVRNLDDPLALHPRYFPLGIACPFLEDESCSIHPDRPLICREYLVTSSAEHCADPTAGGIRRLPMYAVSTDALRLEYRGRTASRIALVLALEWAEAHADDEPDPRPPLEWIEQLRETDPEAPRRGPANG